MSKVIVPNCNPQLELVEVRTFDDGGQYVRYQPVVAWVVDPSEPELGAEPVVTDERGGRWGLHDRATGRAWVPGEQVGELHHLLSYLGLGGGSDGV